MYVYVNIYIYIIIYIYIYTTQIPKAAKVLLPNLSTCIWGPRPTSFGHNVWSKPSSLGSTTVKVVLFYPLCHNIIVFYLQLFTSFYHFLPPSLPSISISKHNFTASPSRRSLLFNCASASPAQAQFRVTAASAMAKPAKRMKAFFKPCLGDWQCGQPKNISLSIINND